MTTITNFFIDLMVDIFTAIFGIFPDSPFKIQIPSEFLNYISYLNYFLPLPEMVAVTVTFVTAVSIWYGVRWLLRAIRYIQ